MGWSRELQGACAPDEKSYARVQSLLEEGSLRHSARVATEQTIYNVVGVGGREGALPMRGTGYMYLLCWGLPGQTWYWIF